MGQITSRRFRRRPRRSNSVSEGKAFSDNNIAHKERTLPNQPWTSFDIQNSTKSTSEVQGLSSLAAASDTPLLSPADDDDEARLTLLRPPDERRFGGSHYSDLTIAARRPNSYNEYRKPDQRLTGSDVILRKKTSRTGNGRIFDGIILPDDAKVSEVLSQTVTFLSYEIDPILIAEFIQRRAKRNRKQANDASGGPTSAISEEDVSKILSKIVSDLNSDEYRSFCDLIRTIGCDSHVLDFLEALDDLLRLVTSAGSGNQASTPVLEKKPLEIAHGCTCLLSSDDERILWNRNSSTMTSSSAPVDRHFEIRFLYADRESRAAQPFPEVELLKRRKRRKSRLPVAYGHHVTVLGDTSDRYVPMISVRLFNCCLCEGQMRRLSRVLEWHSCIRDLAIVETRFDTPAKIRLGHALGQNLGLFQLDLRRCALGNEGAMFLANALRKNDSIRVLNLSQNEINSQGCALIARALSRNRTLTDLDLGVNEVGDGGCRHLANVVANNSALRHLRLAFNGIGSLGATNLLCSLRTNSHLQTLDLSNNSVGDTSIVALSEVLILNRTLRELALNRCEISEVGCRALARTLKANMKLRALKLSDNRFGDGGLIQLAEGVKFNRSLEELTFDGCGITNLGLLKLLDSTRHNATLKSVRLCRNNDITLSSRASMTSSAEPQPIRSCREAAESRDDDVDFACAESVREVYARLRQANPNLAIVLKENGFTKATA